jgi:dinuclear metal center YbgI/SA1388 family protein
MKINKVIDEILRISPIRLQHDYDNSGLQVGDINKSLKNILITLDVSAEAIKRAKKNGANLIISHHPLIFNALKRVNTRDNTGKKIESAIKNDICVYSSHTNFDSANGGMNDLLAALLDIHDLSPMLCHEDSDLCKLVVFVPAEYEDKVKKALFAIGAGVIGEYSGCSFSMEGEGSFVAPDSSNPFIGERGRRNSVDETRIEMVIKRRLLDRAAYEILNIHPYEEPAFDIYPLLSRDLRAGSGRIGTLNKDIPLSTLIKRVKEKLKIDNLRYVGIKTKKVKRIALCSGSGGSLIGEAIKAGADAYITGDIKYHEAKLAEEAGLLVVDAGHFATEVIFVDYLKKHLKGFLIDNGSLAKVFTYKARDPFNQI